ncbi:conserved hypothetical protein [Paraburkholderia tropica]|uniref:hypothetical protein n=1 Tax=Paraburkholderia tropica TaxID=92647 RepID=UPI001CAC9D9E|nr:hypothetical protein [Paraburkholderia tropica]CAG9192349.1 conserved hypothetical protein [Paraburkholderia tropica]
MNPRDDRETRRKQYAMRRLTRAMQRLIHANDDVDRMMARRWVNAWSGAVGERAMNRITPLTSTGFTRTAIRVSSADSSRFV